MNGVGGGFRSREEDAFEIVLRLPMAAIAPLSGDSPCMLWESPPNRVVVAGAEFPPAAGIDTTDEEGVFHE